MKVNGEVAGRDRILSDGDSVEIIDNELSEEYKPNELGETPNARIPFEENGSLNDSKSFINL